jgi:CRP/FNR family transcriptional regulator, cyclic AMP receptor protein
VSHTIHPVSKLQLEQLREIGLFGALTDSVLETLMNELQTLEFSAGSTVMTEGEHAREMFVVMSGELEVLRRALHTKAERRVALLNAGTWFGEMSIVDVQPRSATVRTVTDTVLLRIAAEDLDRLYRRDMKSYLLMILNIARELSRRLRVADGLVAGLLSDGWEIRISKE